MRQGYTLVELLIVLSIISIVSALMVPRVVGHISSMNLRTASQKTIATLRYARNRAVSERAIYIVTLNFDKRCIVLFKRKNGKTENPPSEKHLYTEKRYSLPNGVRFEKFITSKEEERKQGIQKVFFFPDGSSSGGKIFLSNTRGQQYLIQIDFITGLAKLSTVSQ